MLFFIPLIIIAILQVFLLRQSMPTEDEFMHFLNQFNLTNLNDVESLSNLSEAEQVSFLQEIMQLYKNSILIFLIFSLGSTAMIISLISGIAHHKNHLSYILKKGIGTITLSLLLIIMITFIASILISLLPNMIFATFIMVFVIFFKIAFDVMLIAHEKPVFFASLKSAFLFLRKNLSYFSILLIYFIATLFFSSILNNENMIFDIINGFIQMMLITVVYCFLFRLYDQINTPTINNQYDTRN